MATVSQPAPRRSRRTAPASRSKVAVVATRPETVLDDIGRAMRLAGYQETLSPSLAPRPRSIRRLQFVSLLRIGITLTMWLTTNLVQGHLRDELRSVAQWGPPVGAVAASLLMLAIAGSPAHARIHLIQEARPRGP